MTESKSFQSECQLLGSMYLEPACIPNVLEIVRDDCYFESPENRILFNLLIQLYNEGIRPDLIILENRLAESHLLKAVGGMSYISAVADAVATPKNYALHAKHVRNCYLERRLSGLKDAIRAVETEPGTVTEKINIVARDFEELQNEVKTRPAAACCGLEKRIADTVAGKRSIIKSPWPLMDSLTRALMPGTLTLICGSPGASKSFMLLQLLVHLIDHGISAAVLETEEDKEFHAMRALAMRSEVPGLTDPDWVHANPEQSWGVYNEHRDWSRKVESSISATDTQITFSQAARWIREKARAGCRLIAVDPITAVQSTRQDVWSEHNEFLQQVKQVATEYNVAVVFVTHPVKNVSYPDLNQLAGSAAFGRFCQSALWLEYIKGGQTSEVKTQMGTVPMEYNRVLHVLKSRNGTGQGCRIACDFGPDLRLKECGLIVAKKTKYQSYES